MFLRLPDNVSDRSNFIFQNILIDGNFSTVVDDTFVPTSLL